MFGAESHASMNFFIYFGQVVLTLQIPCKFSECLDLTALVCVITEHFVHLFQIIAGDTVGNDMYRVADLGHIKTGGFHAGGGIRPGDIKLVYAICLDKCSKFFTCQSVALGFQEDVFRYDLHLGNKLCAFCACLEGACTCGKIIVLDVHNMHSLTHSPIYCGVDFIYDFLVVFRDVVLNIDDNQCFRAHNTSSHLMFIIMFHWN